MKNKCKPLLISTLLFILFLNFFACKSKNPFVLSSIAGATIIENTKQEFVFVKPFKPKKMINKICFEYTDKIKVDLISEPPKFSDGVPLKLAPVAVDQNGREYLFDHVENSVENYLCLRPQDGEWLEISNKDIVLIKLIVSSNRKINLSKIEWVSYDIWDI